MASFADIGNTLQVLAGVSLILGVAMAVYWGTRRGYPGFGLWTICNILFAVSCMLLADQAHFAKFTVTVSVPALIVLGTIMRLEGLRRFFGRPRFDYRTLVVPVVATALLIIFQYGRDSDLARTEVVVAGFFLATAGVAATFITQARRTGKRSYLVDGALASLSCALLVAYGIYWATGVPLPLIDLTRPNFAFFILVVMFEVVWFIVFLSLGTTKTTETLERAKAAVENSLRQLAAIVAFLPDATFAIDRERRVIAWNRAAEELTGVPAGDALGKTTHEIARTVSMQEAPALLDLVFDEGLEAPAGLMSIRREGDVLSAELETEFPGKPGRVRHLWAVATLLRDQDGRVTGAIESLRDVSSREQAEQIIRQREQQYRSLFELSLDGILVVAPDGSLQDANPAACAMLGMTKEELRLAGHAGVVARGPGVEERLRSRPLEGQDYQEFTFIRKDRSTFTAACTSVTYRDNSGFSRAFIVFRDITEQLEAQRILRESEARLLQAQAVAHVGNCEIDLRGAEHLVVARGSAHPRACPDGRLHAARSLRAHSHPRRTGSGGGCTPAAAGGGWQPRPSLPHQAPQRRPGAHRALALRHRLRRRRPSRPDPRGHAGRDRSERGRRHLAAHAVFDGPFGRPDLLARLQGTFRVRQRFDAGAAWVYPRGVPGHEHQRPRPDRAHARLGGGMAANQGARQVDRRGRPHDESRRADACGAECHLHRARRPRVQLRLRARHHPEEAG